MLWTPTAFVGAYGSLDSSNPNVSSARTTAFLGAAGAAGLVWAGYRDRAALGQRAVKVAAGVGSGVGALVAVSIDFESCSAPCISDRYVFLLPLALAWGITALVFLLIGWNAGPAFSSGGKLRVAHLGNVGLGAAFFLAHAWVMVAAQGLADNARQAHSQDTPGLVGGFVFAAVLVAAWLHRGARQQEDVK
ncbi:MAG: hypothetical protein HYT80_04120 [Euryarchaeota archaeon]|nr:hypothetical protein [Euryarchaeota archaeon]